MKTPAHSLCARLRCEQTEHVCLLPLKKHTHTYTNCEQQLME